MTFRSRALLDLAKLAPRCMVPECGRYNDGSLVAMHRNEDKGIGLKRPDFEFAVGCQKCHFELDQGKSLSRDDRRALWMRAYWATQSWLWEEGLVCVTGAPEPSEAVSAPNRKVSRSRPIASRGFDRSKSRGFDGKVREK